MVFQQNFQIYGKCLASTLSMLILSPVGFCQATAAEDKVQPSSDTVEEVVVYGEKTLMNLRNELRDAEKDFFATFNELNNGAKFDVHCKSTFQIQEHRRVRQCKANFLKDYERHFALGWNPNLATLRRNEKLLIEEMTAQIKEHPELLELFTELAKAKRNYESKRKN